MKGRKDFDTGRLRWLALVVLAVLAVCISIAGANTVADSNPNGQYEVTLTVNPDGTMVVNAVGVLGGSYTNGGEPAGTFSDTSGGFGVENSYPYYNNMEMSGSYGYALLTGTDASGNKAAVETGFTNGENVHVTQEIRLNSPEEPEESSQVTYSQPVDENGIEASQHVRSCDFDSIFANAIAQAIDGSTAAVSASATNDDCWAKFGVNQWASIDFDPFDGGKMPQYGDGGMFGGTEAHQDGSMKSVDTASVSASASSPAGFTSGVYGGIMDGSMRFRTWASAENESNYKYVGYGSSSSTLYETEANGDIDTSSQQGFAGSYASSPSGDSASVSSQWTWDRCHRPGDVYSDLEASTTEKTNKYVIDTDMELHRDRGYSGTISAQNTIDGLDSTSIHRNNDAWSGIMRKTTTGYTHSWNGVDT